VARGAWPFAKDALGKRVARTIWEGAWHPYPGCLRMSGKERTYATWSAQEWQIKNLQMGFFAYRCNLGGPEGVPPPRVFCRKSVDLLYYKRVEFFRSAKESAIL